MHVSRLTALRKGLHPAHVRTTLSSNVRTLATATSLQAMKYSKSKDLEVSSTQFYNEEQQQLKLNVKKVY